VLTILLLFARETSRKIWKHSQEFSLSWQQATVCFRCPRMFQPFQQLLVSVSEGSLPKSHVRKLAFIETSHCFVALIYGMYIIRMLGTRLTLCLFVSADPACVRWESLGLILLDRRPQIPLPIFKVGKHFYLTIRYFFFEVLIIILYVIMRVFNLFLNCIIMQRPM
jgi:hypothetical protein